MNPNNPNKTMGSLQFKTKKQVRFIPFYLFIFFIAVYLLTAAGSNFYDTDASKLRIEVVKSIIERADLAVPDSIGLKGINGKSYAWGGIGSVMLAVPLYILGEYVGSPENAVSIMNQIFGAATAVLVFLFSIVLGYSKRASLCVTMFYGLGTFAWPLAKHPFDHTIETFFILLSVYCIYLYVRNKKLLYLLLSGFSLGFAFITRQTSVLVIPPLFILMIVYYLKRYNLKITAKQMIRDIILFSLAFLPFIGLILWYNYYRFGSIFETGYQLIAERTGIDFFTGTPLLTGLKGFLISPGKGFFYYSPVAILFFFGIKSFCKRHLELALCFILIMLSYLFFLSKNLYWHGDWAWGPRYILAITPFFIIPIAEIIDKHMWLGKKFLRITIYSLFAISLVIQIAAVSVSFYRYFFYLTFEKKVTFIRAEPPSEIYFEWHKSPLLSQFGFIYEIAKDMKTHGYLETYSECQEKEKFKYHPSMSLFDFWFVYRYNLNGKCSIFIEAIIFLLIAIYTGTRLKKAVS